MADHPRPVTNPLTSDLCLEIKERDSVEASSQGDTECTKKDPSGETGVIEGQSPTETALVSRERSSDEPEVKAACQSEYSPLEDREEMETMEETNKEAFKTQDEPNEGGFNGHTDVQESTGSKILEIHEYSHPEQTAWSLVDVSQQDSLCSSNTYSSVTNLTEVKEKPVSPCDLYFDLSSPVNTEVGLPAEPTETLNPASNSRDGQDEANSGDSGANAKVSPANKTSVKHTEVNLFYADTNSSSPSEELFGEALEPMDLFYPDKEDAMLTDPAEMDTEFLPSVFGVFALQPAPVSEPLLPDIDPTWEETDVGNPKVPDEDFDNGGKLAMEKMEEGVDTEELESRQLSGSAPKSPVVVIGGMGPVEQMGPTEDGHRGDGRGQSIVKGDTEPMSSDEDNPRQPGEDLIPTVLRHRKATSVFNSSDKQMMVPIIKINSNNADLGEGSLLDGELYLILLLWLLLYCLWLLPQMELCALPSLLFNLDR